MLSAVTARLRNLPPSLIPAASRTAGEQLIRKECSRRVEPAERGSVSRTM